MSLARRGGGNLQELDEERVRGNWPLSRASVRTLRDLGVPPRHIARYFRVDERDVAWLAADDDSRTAE